MRFFTKMETVIGELYLIAEENRLSAIHMGEEDFLANEEVGKIVFEPDQEVLLECSKQLQEYFSGSRKEFNLPLDVKGTSFQKVVWAQLALIPFGETRSYQDMAHAINNPKAVRAIGQANKRNPFPIIIPCHRVIGKNHSLVGYAGTRVDLKEKLLKLEGALN